jgi:hypothetical protein
MYVIISCHEVQTVVGIEVVEDNDKLRHASKDAIVDPAYGQGDSRKFHISYDLDLD